MTVYGLSYQPMKDKEYDRCKFNGRPLACEGAHETLVLRFGPSLFAYTKCSIRNPDMQVYRDFPQYVSYKQKYVHRILVTA